MFITLKNQTLYPASRIWKGLPNHQWEDRGEQAVKPGGLPVPVLRSRQFPDYVCALWTTSNKPVHQLFKRG